MIHPTQLDGKLLLHEQVCAHAQCSRPRAAHPESHSLQVSALLVELGKMQAIDPSAKAVVFSSWGRLLKLVNDALTNSGIGNVSQSTCDLWITSIHKIVFLLTCLQLHPLLHTATKDRLCLADCMLLTHLPWTGPRLLYKA